MSEPDFTLSGADLGYRAPAILVAVDLEIPSGASVGVVGPNGAGKTTLLRSLLGVLAPLAGAVTHRPGMRWGFVPQREAFDQVWPLSVEEVVFQGLLPECGWFPRLSDEGRDRIQAALASVGMTEHLAAPYRDLSGGQRQRVLMARALVSDPDWLILDEPTAGLDVPSQERTLARISELRGVRPGLGVLLVSHQITDVLNHCDWVVTVTEGSVRLLPVQALFTDAALSEFYGMPVRCFEAEGYRAVHPVLSSSDSP